MKRRELPVLLLLKLLAAAASAEEPDAFVHGQVFGPNGQQAEEDP